MAPARISEPWTSPAHQPEPYDGPPRNIAYIDAVKFDESLQPKNYEILGTHPDSKLLFVDVNILEATGKLIYQGDVYIEGEWNNNDSHRNQMLTGDFRGTNQGGWRCAEQGRAAKKSQSASISRTAANSHAWPGRRPHPLYMEWRRS